MRAPTRAPVGVPRLWLAIPPAILFFLCFQDGYAAEGQRSLYTRSLCIGVFRGRVGIPIYIPDGLSPSVQSDSGLVNKKVDTRLTSCYTCVVSFTFIVTPVHNTLRETCRDRGGTHPFHTGDSNVDRLRYGLHVLRRTSMRNIRRYTGSVPHGRRVYRADRRDDKQHLGNIPSIHCRKHVLRP